MTALVRRGTVLALIGCFGLAPMTARADVPAPASPAAATTSINFVPPKGWSDTSRPNERPGLWKDWSIQDGADVHSIVLSVTHETRRAAAYGDDSVAAFKQLSFVKMLDSGPTTVCGDVPAFGYTYRSDRNPAHPLIIRHLLVDIGPALGDVSYAHAPGVADRADALDAMTTLCDKQIYAMQPPAGWRRSDIPGVTPKDPRGVDGFTAPTGSGVLLALAVSNSVRGAAAIVGPAHVNAPAVVVSDVEEQCGTLRVRHHVVRAPGLNGAGPRILETVSGYRHGATYVYSYVRPEAEAADPAAQRALTSFCDANATLATPPPSPV
jgi:hypothetical protein